MIGLFGHFFKKPQKKPVENGLIDILIAQREIALIVNKNLDLNLIMSQTFDVISPLFGNSPVFQVVNKKGGDLVLSAIYQDSKLNVEGPVIRDEIVQMALSQGRIISATEGERHTVAIPLDSESVWVVKMTLQGDSERKSDLISLYMHRLEELAKFVALAVKTPDLYHKATRDPLTGLGNRQYFNDQLDFLFSSCKRYHDSLSLVLIDIDHFKSINDTYGHLAGDHVLSNVAKIISKVARTHVDLVFRYGGEEIVILLPKTDVEGGFNFAERLREKIEQSKFSFEGNTIRVTVSIGVSSLKDHKNSDELIAEADRALYSAKESGRNKTETTIRTK